MHETSLLPLIDVGPLVTGRGDRVAVAAALRNACRDSGFFYVVGEYLLGKVSRVFPQLRGKVL